MRNLSLVTLSLSSSTGGGGGGAPPTAPVIQLVGSLYSNTSALAYQWTRDASDISGQTGSSYTHVGANDDFTVIQQRNGITFSNGIIKGTDRNYLTETFSTTNGTDLIGWNGWAGTDAGSLKIYNGKLSQYAGQGSASFFTHSGSGANQRITLEGWYLTGGNNNDNTRILMLRYSNTSNQVRLAIQTTGWTIQTRIGGSFVLNSFFNKTFAGEAVTLQIVNDRIRVFFDGVEASESVSAGGWDCSGVPAATGVGFRGGIAGGVKTFGDTFQVASRITVDSIPATGIYINTLTLGAPDLSNGHPYPTLRIQATVTGSTTSGKIILADAAGNVLQPFTAPVAVSAGTIDTTIQITSPAAQGITCLVGIVDPSDHTIGTFAQQAIGFYPSLVAVQFGMNTGGYPAYGKGDVIRDRGIVAKQYQTIGSNGTKTYSFPTTADGNWPSGAYAPGGYDRNCFLLWESSQSQRAGVYDITFPPGLTAAWNSFQNISASSVNSAAGTASITVTDTTSTTNAELQLSGTPTGGWTSAGCQISAIPHADANPTRPVTDQFVSDYGLADSGLKVFRFMKGSGAEDSHDYPQGKYRYFTPEWVADTANLLNVHPWITLPNNMSDADILDFAQRLYARLNSNLNPIIERGNEAWNGSTYARQFSFLAWSAANAGLISGVTAGTVINGNTYAADGSYTGATPNASTGVTNRAFNYGDVISCTGTGYQTVIAQVVQVGGTTIGDVIPASGNNGKFNVIKVFGDIYPALLKYQVRKQVEMGNIFKSVFGGRAKSVLGVFLLGGSANITMQLAFESAWQSLDGWSPSAYIGSAITYNPAVTSWHGDHSLNQANFITQYRAKVVIDAGNTIGTLQTLMSEVENYMRSTLAIPKTTPVPGIYIYEAGIHDLFTVPASATITAAIATTTMTVTVATAGTILVGMEIKNGATSYGFVRPYGTSGTTGTGGTGTYALVGGGTFASGSLSVSAHTEMRNALAAVKQNAGFGSDLTTYYYTPLINKVGGIQAHFVDYEDWAVINSQNIQLFGTLSQSQGVRTNERVWTALTTAALANP